MWTMIGLPWIFGLLVMPEIEPLNANRSPLKSPWPSTLSSRISSSGSSTLRANRIVSPRNRSGFGSSVAS